MSKPSQQEIGLAEAPGINAGFCRDGSQREPGSQLLSPPHPAPIFLSHLSRLHNNAEETVLCEFFFLKKQTEQNALPARASAVLGGSQEKMGVGDSVNRFPFMQTPPSTRLTKPTLGCHFPHE